jgi:Sulfotransferase family
MPEQKHASNPILVTGAHRSGTTWVGKMLCAGGGSFYIHEPFNNVHEEGPAWVPKPFPYWFFCIRDQPNGYERLLADVVAMKYPLPAALGRARNPRHLAKAIRDWSLSLLARAAKKRPLLKDPVALFSAEWLARRFDMKVVVLIRHPAAFAASLKRLDWWFKFFNWLDQKPLMEDYLKEYEGIIRTYMAGQKDLVRQAAIMWNCMYSTVRGYQQRHPEWHFVTHERLASDPVEGFRALYSFCGLSWNSRAEADIRRHSETPAPAAPSPDRPADIRRESRKTIGGWKKILTTEEIAVIREETCEVASHFYQSRDWE